MSITVSNVNHPPVANNDSASTPQNTAVTVSVLANDTDPDNDLLTVTGASVPAHGTAVVNGGATITYTPASGYPVPTRSATRSVTATAAPRWARCPSR